MKTLGIILVILGSLSLISFIIALANGYTNGTNGGGGIMVIVIGAYLVSRANKKKAEEAEKKKWEN